MRKPLSKSGLDEELLVRLVYGIVSIRTLFVCSLFLFLEVASGMAVDEVVLGNGSVTSCKDSLCYRMISYTQKL
jgi:hypothetical protein